MLQLGCRVEREWLFRALSLALYTARMAWLEISVRQIERYGAGRSAGMSQAFLGSVGYDY